MQQIFSEYLVWHRPWEAPREAKLWYKERTILTVNKSTDNNLVNDSSGKWLGGDYNAG